jgi:tetratricopeptide (TPR) repeat protein/MFS family permease
MELFKKLNRIVGWAVFAVATIVYFLTVEPTASWWDCGEYISTAYKLQVGHPPGAPLFQMIGRFFTLFAFGNVSKVALMVNIMSALSSSFTILFLFWTITHLAKKIALLSGEMDQGRMIAVLGSGVTGALAYTFSDSFWFSAVEGEVYAMSSLFTAVVFWAMLRWEEDPDEKHSIRWILLIAYLVGLSIGVHLLNLLAIPAIAFIYYFKKFKPSGKGIFFTAVISIAIIGIIMNGIIPWIVKLSSVFELLFVNSFGLPFNSGTAFYFIILIGLIIWGFKYTARKAMVVLNSVILGFVFILIGYSSFFMIIIRSNANPPIDENSPEDAISLLSYLAREQYGDWPILYGPYYNAPTVDLGDGNPVYVKDVKKGKYIITDDRKNTEPVYDSRFMTLFPRMWSNQKSSHIEMYKQYGKVKGIPIEVDDGEKSETRIKPTFGENLRFFFTYQIGHMYLRYLMWNFSGRQNDIESQGEIENGNWITGFNWFDENILGLGPQGNLPDSMKNPAHNKFFMLPFLLGLIGLFYHMKAHKRDTLVVALLFIMTGLAIIVYLNQYPYQPRERDYAYAGSFYAFAIWIGLGVMAVWDWISKKTDAKISAIAVAAVTFFAVPVLMASQGWDDHDRSGKYASRDFAANYLNSCEPNAILFTNGDNDTFPLWYAQEVEGIRTDVRVVNFMLASGHWYIHQMMNKAYQSEPLPFTLTYDQYQNGVNNAVVFYNTKIQGYVELKQIIDFIASDNENSKVTLSTGEKIGFIPTKKFKLTIDSAAIIRNKAVPAYMADKVVPSIEWEVRQNYLYKNDLMLLDIIATNNWKRPIYFANPNSISKVLGIENYCHLEGMVYKFMPVKAENYISGVGGVDTEGSYDIFTNKCTWGRLNVPDVSVDRESARNSIIPKQNFMRVAESLVSMGEKQKAINLLDLCLKEFPDSKIAFDMYMIPFADVYYEAGAMDKGNAIARRVLEIYRQNLDYYNSLNSRLFKYFETDYNQALTVVQRLSVMAKMYKQNDLHKEIDSLFKEQLKILK